MWNFFDPSMAIGGAAISFFPNLNFGKQYCEKNWLYALLELCFVQKIVQNGQKVSIETRLNFGEIGKKCDKLLILQYSVI